MTPEEFFDLYSIGQPQRKRWTRMLAGYRWEDLCAGLDRVVAGAQSTATPTLAQVRSAITRAQAGRDSDEKRQQRLSQGVSEKNSATELALFGLIRGLNRRGVWWCFSRLRWISGETDRQDYRSARVDGRPNPTHTNRASTLAEAREAWTRYCPGEPEPQPVRSTAEALSFPWGEKVV
jgi:hypothetical protein